MVPGVTPVVDVNLVGDVVPEAVEVGAAGRILEGDIVGDDDGPVRIVRRHECVEVGVVGERVLRDQGSLPVAGSARRERGHHQARRCRGSDGQRNALSHG